MKILTLLLLLLSTNCFSQLNFGAKTGVFAVDNKDSDGNEFLNLNESVFFSAFLEYKGLDFAGEFEISYYSTKGSTTMPVFSNSKATALIPSLVLKYYPVDNFNIKAGYYLNSTNLEYKSTLSSVDIDEEFNIEDSGFLIGMEAYIYNGLFADVRVLLGGEGGDDLKTSHIMLGVGYKI